MLGITTIERATREPLLHRLADKKHWSQAEAVGLARPLFAGWRRNTQMWLLLITAAATLLKKSRRT
jgi:hypothetical protein